MVSAFISLFLQGGTHLGNSEGWKWSFIALLPFVFTAVIACFNVNACLFFIVLLFCVVIVIIVKWRLSANDYAKK